MLEVHPIFLSFKDDAQVGRYKNRGELKSRGWGHDGFSVTCEIRRKRDTSVSYLNVTLWKMGVPEFSFYKSCEMMR